MKKPETKVCTKCGIEKELNKFHIDKRNKIDGRQAQCKKCRREWYECNKESEIERVKVYRESEHGKRIRKIYTSTEEYKIKKRQKDKEYAQSKKGKETIKKYRKTEHSVEMNKRCKRKLNYGLSQEEFEKLIEEQNGVCAICKKPETEARNGEIYEFCVDHSHKTGHVRGLVCRKCNSGLGLFKDDSKLLLDAYSYLENVNFEKWLKEETKDAKVLGLI